MKEYIERAAVHELIKRIPGYEMFSYDRTETLIGISPDDVDFGVDKIPAADVVEVRHGHWIDLNAENSTGPLFKCSECSHLHNPNRNDLDLERVELNPLYCDACGARMDKEEEHET
jgi:hypothetical protein